MNKYDRIKQIKNIARNDKEAITMLLSACADMGSEKGAFLSVAIFDDAAEIILEYLAERHLTQQCSGLAKLVENQKDMPPEFNQVVDKMLDDLIANR